MYDTNALWFLNPSKLFPLLPPQFPSFHFVAVVLTVGEYLILERILQSLNSGKVVLREVSKTRQLICGLALLLYLS